MVPTRYQINNISPIHAYLHEFYGEAAAHEKSVSRQFRPAMDMKEDEGAYYAMLELPGMAKEDVKIALEEDILTIKGEKMHETEEDTDAYKRIERSFGTFERSIRLPREINASEISAEMKNGILYITIPKTEQTEARHIIIN